MTHKNKNIVLLKTPENKTNVILSELLAILKLVHNATVETITLTDNMQTLIDSLPDNTTRRTLNTMLLQLKQIEIYEDIAGGQLTHIMSSLSSTLKKDE